MAVRQYIGARYVPLFMGEWDNKQSYEPLSIVLHQGDSYTSRQAVPVGIDITNENYWFVSGNFNAQIEAYRQEVAGFSQRITDLDMKFPIASDDITDNAIATRNIQDASIVASKLASSAVTTAKIADANVTTAKIADTNVTTAKIANAAVTADKLASNAVTTAKIADTNVTTAKIANAAVTADKLASNAVTTAKIADANVTKAKLSTSLQASIDRIDALSAKKHMVVIGDSFSTPAYSTNANMWYNGVAHQQNLTYHNYAVSGSGFIHASSAANNFGIQLDRAIADTAFDNADVRLVIIFGGLNDANELSGNNVFNAAVLILNKAKVEFPNAKIVIAGCNTYKTITSTAVVEITRQLDRAAYERGCSFINTLYAVVASSLVSEEYNWHPNDRGQLAYASIFNSGLSGNKFVSNRNYSFDHQVGGGTAQIRFRDNHVDVFGTFRTDANGEYSGNVPDGLGYIVYQPLFAFSKNVNNPVLTLEWSYGDGEIHATGGAPNTSYQCVQICQTW